MNTIVDAIRGRLMMRGKSLASWAIERGYRPRTVHQVLRRWACREGSPRGVMTTRILRDLARETGVKLPSSPCNPTPPAGRRQPMRNHP